MSGFLGRWSQRKQDAREGKPAEAEPADAAAALSPAQPAGPEGVGAAATGEVTATQETPPEPLPTLDDVQALTSESDFTRFGRPGVAPEVRNAAMKKLFADPRFNVMDGLDVYIDDYSKPDPIPPEMLRQLASAKFLNLFDKEEKEEELARQKADMLAGHSGRDVADNPTGLSVAQSDGPHQAVPAPPDHADPDLRLQQDDAAGARKPGHGAG